MIALIAALALGQAEPQPLVFERYDEAVVVRDSVALGGFDRARIHFVRDGRVIAVRTEWDDMRWGERDGRFRLEWDDHGGVARIVEFERVSFAVVRPVVSEAEQTPWWWGVNRMTDLRRPE